VHTDRPKISGQRSKDLSLSKNQPNRYVEEFEGKNRQNMREFRISYCIFSVTNTYFDALQRSVMPKRSELHILDTIRARMQSRETFQIQKSDRLMHQFKRISPTTVRGTLDQYYTTPHVVQHCLKQLGNILECDEIIEPFNDADVLLSETNHSNKLGIDRNSKHAEVLKHDFLGETCI